MLLLALLLVLLLLALLLVFSYESLVERTPLSHVMKEIKRKIVIFNNKHLSVRQSILAAHWGIYTAQLIYWV